MLDVSSGKIVDINAGKSFDVNPDRFTLKLTDYSVLLLVKYFPFLFSLFHSLRLSKTGRLFGTIPNKLVSVNIRTFFGINCVNK